MALMSNRDSPLAGRAIDAPVMGVDIHAGRSACFQERREFGQRPSHSVQ